MTSIIITVVQEWLTHPDIMNLEHTPSAYRQEHEKIKSFLAESAPAEESAKIQRAKVMTHLAQR